MMPWLPLLLWLFQAAVPKASLAGTVVRLGTSEPIEDTRVELRRIDLRIDGAHPQQTFEITTSADGRFYFKDLDAGSYRLFAISDGFVRQEFGQRTLDGTGTPLDFVAGKAMKAVVMGLTPTGSVSGHIRDGSGQPLSGVPVVLLRFGYLSTGRRTFIPVSGGTTGKTDDRGEYRLFYITPGRYFLYAGSPSPNSLIERNEILESYSHVFYPSVPDVREAVPVVVEPGLNLPGMDMTMNPQPSFRVRGRIVDSITGKTPLNATVDLTYGNNFQYTNLGNKYIGGEKGTYANGVFEFRHVVPGTFYVTASSFGAGEGVIDNATYRSAAVLVVVSSRDIEDVVVALPGRPAPLSGRMTVEGRQSFLETQRVQIYSPDDDLPQPLTYWSDIIANGVLRFESVSPGDYRVFDRSLDGYYVKEARFGGMDALNESFHFSGSDTIPLQIVMSSNVASVEGRAINGKREPVANTPVVLVPDRHRQRKELFRQVTTDANGRFNISNVPPGDYHVFSWEVLEPYEYFDPDLLAGSASKSVPVHLSELSKQNVEVRVQ